MKKLILFLILNCLAIEYIIGQNSFLQKQGTATQLVVHGMPFLILGGELGNSSAACPQDIERIFPKLKKMGLNTVLVPVYWDLTEPVEGQSITQYGVLVPGIVRFHAYRQSTATSTRE